MTWHTYRAGPSREGYPSGASGVVWNDLAHLPGRSKPGRLPLGGAGAIGSAWWKVMIWKVEGDDLEI